MAEQEPYQAPLPEKGEGEEQEMRPGEAFEAPLPDTTATMDLTPPKPKEEPFEYDPIEHFANTVSSFFNMAKSIVTAVALAPKSGYDFIKSKEYKQLADIWEYKGTAATTLKDMVIGPYQEKGWRILYEDPAVPVVDALSLFTGGAGSVAKTGSFAGKLLPAGSKAARAAKVLERVGMKMEKLPGKLASEMYGRAVAKVTGVDFANYRLLKAGKRRTRAIIPRYIEQVGKPFADVFRKMTDEELQLFDKMLSQGGTFAELNKSARVRKAYELAYEWVKNERELFITQRGVLKAEALEDAVIRKLAVELFPEEVMRVGELTDELVDLARQIYKGEDVIFNDKLYRGLTEVKPLYTPAYHSRRGVQNKVSVELFGQKPIYRLFGRGNIGQFRRFKGAVGRIKDPRIYIFRAIEDWAKYRADMAWMDDVMLRPSMITGVSKTKPAERLREGMVSHYFGGKREYVAAQAKFVNDMIRRLGPDEAFRKLSSDPKMLKELQEVKHVVIDKGVKKFLDMEFRQLGGTLGWLVSVYDSIIGAFRASATVLSPRWYTGNAVGDVMLSMLANGVGGRYRNIGELRRVLPEAESLGKTGLMVETGAGLIDRVPVLRSFPQFTEHVDAIARAGIIDNAIARQLKETGRKFFQSEELLDDAVLRLAGASTEFNALTGDLQTVMERLVRQSPDIQKIRKRLELRQTKVDVLENQYKELLAELYASGLYSEKGKILSFKRRGWKVSNKQKNWYNNFIERIKDTKKNLNNSKRQLLRQQQLLDTSLADLRDSMRLQERLRAKYPELQKIHDEVILPAVERANSFVGDYRGLGPFEQKVLRRVIPFYSWVKTMGQLAFKLPIIAPKSTFLWHRHAEMLFSMVGDDEMPEYMKNAVPVFTRENGDTVWLNMESLSPFNSLRMSRFFDQPFPGQFALWEGNPLINIAFRGAGGKTPFVSSSIPYGEPMVMVGNGDYYRHVGNGEVEKVIPQAPLVSTLAHMFPVVQMLEQLIYRHRMTHNGWLLQPDPVLNPDGSYRYPTELWQSVISALGPRVTIRSKSSFIEADRRRVKRILNELKREYRRADPERREYIRGVFEDYQKADGFRIKYR